MLRENVFVLWNVICRQFRAHTLLYLTLASPIICDFPLDFRLDILRLFPHIFWGVSGFTITKHKNIGDEDIESSEPTLNVL